MVFDHSNRKVTKISGILRTGEKIPGCRATVSSEAFLAGPLQSAGPWPLPGSRPWRRAGLVAKVSGGADPEAGSTVSSQDLPGLGDRLRLEAGGDTGSSLAREKEGKGMVGELGLPRSGSAWGPKVCGGDGGERNREGRGYWVWSRGNGGGQCRRLRKTGGSGVISG